jgi:cytoskeletal protein CcmA (bactofilin family)
MLGTTRDEEPRLIAKGWREPYQSTPAQAPHAVAVPPAEPKWLTVGPGISIAGHITACERLIVQGSVQVTLDEINAIEIAETGRFTEGRAEVEDAEIRGVYEGELIVRGRLLIRGTGRVSGTVRYGEVEIERGGRLLGAVSKLEGRLAREAASKS